MNLEHDGGSGGPTEVVIRPTGLRGGRWEASWWLIDSIAGVALVLALLYGLRRLGFLGRRTLRNIAR